jgi:hypothetical protein
MLLYESSHATVSWDESADSVVIRKKDATSDEALHNEVLNALFVAPQNDTTLDADEWQGIFHATNALKTTSVQ